MKKEKEVFDPSKIEQEEKNYLIKIIVFIIIILSVILFTKCEPIDYYDGVACYENQTFTLCYKNKTWSQKIVKDSTGYHPDTIVNVLPVLWIGIESYSVPYNEILNIQVPVNMTDAVILRDMVSRDTLSTMQGLYPNACATFNFWQ